MIRKKINRVSSLPRVSASAVPAGGSVPNQEYLMSGDHYPDRTLSPLVLQPQVGYTEGTTGKVVANALPELTNGNWYRLDSSNRHLGICDATRISTSQTGTDSAGNPITVFSVSSTPGAADYGRITIRENVPAGETVTYAFVATLSRDGREIRTFFSSRCRAVSEVPDILFDNNPTALYNPLEDPQYFDITPSLTTDDAATWVWKSYHESEGGWGLLGSTHLDWAVKKVGNGIRIDRRKMQGVLILKCEATVTIDGVSMTLEKDVTHTRKLPKYEFDYVGGEEITEDIKAIAPRAIIKGNRATIIDEDEVSVEWYNDSNQLVGRGINPTIQVSSLGTAMVLGLEVRDKGGWCALYDSSDGKYLTDTDGSVLLVREKA